MEMDEKKDPRKEFSEFLKRAYAAYIVRETRNGGNVPSQTDFAQWLGVTQTSFSNWINATRPPDIDNLDAVATKLGNEVYAIFGKPARMPKEPAANVVFTNWYKLTKPQQRQVAEMVMNMAEQNSAEEEDSSQKGGMITNMAGA